MHWTNHTHLLRVSPAMIHHCKTQTHSIIYILSGLHPQMSRRCRPNHAPVLSPPLQIHARNNIKSPLRASPAPVCRCRRKHAPDQSWFRLSGFADLYMRQTQSASSQAFRCRQKHALGTPTKKPKKNHQSSNIPKKILQKTTNPSKKTHQSIKNTNPSNETTNQKSKSTLERGRRRVKMLRRRSLTQVQPPRGRERATPSGG